MNDDLWAEASASFASEQREASLALADAHLESVMPFLLSARSAQEYAHRSALAQDSIRAIAAQCGLPEDELMAVARRRYELYREALAEGQDPVEEVAGLAQGGSGYGSGPLKPDGHSEGPDYSGGYSEVPAGAPGGPDPSVTRPRPPFTGPVTEATGARRTAADDPVQAMTPSYLPPDTGLGDGSVDLGTPSAATGGFAPSAPAGAARPGMGTSVSAADPVHGRVATVRAMISQSNPGLPLVRCDRIARMVVGRYLTADLAGSVVNDAPVSDEGTTDSGDKGGSGDGLGGKALEWKGLKSMMPGAGGAAGEAAGAGGLAELAPLAAV